jgi:hypothetical protein
MATTRHPPFERIALALQGGGALGAYQGGVSGPCRSGSPPRLSRGHFDRRHQRCDHCRKSAGISRRQASRVLDRARQGRRQGRRQGSRQGGRVNVVCPGFVRTPLVDKQIPEQARELGISEQEVNVMLKETVDGEFTTLEDVAETALFLASFGSNALTGQSVVAVSSPFASLRLRGRRLDIETEAGHRAAESPRAGIPCLKGVLMRNILVAMDGSKERNAPWTSRRRSRRGWRQPLEHHCRR